MGKDIKFKTFTICTRGRLVSFERPAVMGILNITDDSFYDGGRHNTLESASEHAERLLSDGADIIDIGAASSRPGATLPSTDVEIGRLVPVIRHIREVHPEALISVDTCFSDTSQAVIDAGADIINDISGGQFDDRMFDTVAKLQVPYILMHTTALPDEMQHKCHYNDIVQDICLYLSERLNRLYELGVKDVWIDPGFGFGKTVEQNHELLDRLDELTSEFREPLLAGLSRKSMIYRKLGITPAEALNGTTVLNTKALMRGSRILRVHDPKEALEAVKLLYD